MPRPLTGGLTFNEKAGTFTASVPARKNSRQRRTATFSTRAEAEQWVATSLRILSEGKDVPPFVKPGPGGAPRGTRLLDVGEDYIQEHYVQDEHGNVDREEQVRGYVTVMDTYMVSKQLTIESMTRRDARDMWLHLLKRHDIMTEPTIPAGINPEVLVTKREAITLLGENGFAVSDSTFKRAKRHGHLRPADTSEHAHLYRVGDLFSPEAKLVRRRAEAASDSGGRYAHSTLREVRRTFRAVMEHAAADGIQLQKGVRGAEIARDRTPKQKIRALTWAETARIAGRLHVVHQTVLWLLRVLGLRIGEAYGILVEDVLDGGPEQPGLITIQSQGGKKYRRRNPDKTTSTHDHIDETKTDSFRILVVPSPLMDLVRTVIEVFHASPAGLPDGTARLVPGLTDDNRSGQSAFRSAMTEAGALDGLDITFENRRSAKGSVNVTPTPHHLRKTFASALQADSEAIEDIRAALGQRRGQSVLHVHYLLEELELKAQRRVAETVTGQIQRELPTGLMLPTRVPCTTGHQPALERRREHIDAGLHDSGWLVEATPAGDWFSVTDAAALGGVSEQQVRDRIRKGRLSAIVTDRPDQAGTRYLVAAESALDQPSPPARSAMADLADEFGIAYDVLRQFISRHPVLALEREEGRRDGELSAEAVEVARSYFAEQEQLAERAVRMPDAARELGISVASIGTLVRQGKLVEDVRFHGGVRSLTRASYEAFVESRPRRSRTWSRGT